MSWRWCSALFRLREWPIDYLSGWHCASGYGGHSEGKMDLCYSLSPLSRLSLLLQKKKLTMRNRGSFFKTRWINL